MGAGSLAWARPLANRQKSLASLARQSAASRPRPRRAGNRPRSAIAMAEWAVHYGIKSSRENVARIIRKSRSSKSQNSLLKRRPIEAWSTFLEM